VEQKREVHPNVGSNTIYNSALQEVGQEREVHPNHNTILQAVEQQREAHPDDNPALQEVEKEREVHHEVESKEPKTLCDSASNLTCATS
jgi:hypothetical protein